MYIEKLNVKSIEIWHRRLNSFYYNNLCKYLDLHNKKIFHA